METRSDELGNAVSNDGAMFYVKQSGVGAGPGTNAGVGADAGAAASSIGADEPCPFLSDELLGSATPASAVSAVFDRVPDFDGAPVTWDRIRELHRSCAPNPAAFGLLWTHCRIVALLARDFARRYAFRAKRQGLSGPNEQLVVVGGLLHDIGVYRVFAADGVAFDHDRYLFHGLEGWLILHENGFGERIAGFARDHTGVGMTRRDVLDEGLRLPADDYSPRTLEEELVMYADKFHTKSNPPTFVSPAAARRSARRFGEAKARRLDRFAEKFGEPDLEELAAACGMEIRR